MTILRQATNLSCGTDIESRHQKHEDKDTISNTTATGSADNFVDTTTEQQSYMDFLTYRAHLILFVFICLFSEIAYANQDHLISVVGRVPFNIDHHHIHAYIT